MNLRLEMVLANYDHLPKIPQIHFIGTDGTIIPVSIVNTYKNI